jgi:general secretion pathway protein G
MRWLSKRGDGDAQKKSGHGMAGFTLIELLVVLVILGLLLGLVGPRVLNYLGSAKTDTAGLQLKNLSATLDLYRLDVGRYPTAEQGLDALITQPKGVKGWAGPYLKGSVLPNDPWDRAYIYRFPGEQGQPYDLLSLGADGRAGGDGENQDLTNWQ